MNERDAVIDSLRGLAIVVMMIDHVSMLVFGQGFELFGIRFFTRIAEPLFAIIFGYLLIGRSKQGLARRLKEILLVALLANIVYFSITQKLEILVSFAIATIAYYFLGSRLRYLIFFFILYPVDFTKHFLDYPMSIVISQVAFGMFLRELKQTAQLSPLFICFLLGPFIVPVPLGWTLGFTAFAGGLFLIAKRAQFNVSLFSTVGKKPLTYYLLQYIVILLIAILVNGL